MSISENLKELRKSKNLTQFQLSCALNIGQATIACYENGIREPHISNLIAYANFFECSIDYLIGREDDFGNVTIKKEKSPDLTSEEEQLLEDYRSLPRPEQAQASEYVSFLAIRRGNKQNKHA